MLFEHTPQLLNARREDMPEAALAPWALDRGDIVVLLGQDELEEAHADVVGGCEHAGVTGYAECYRGVREPHAPVLAARTPSEDAAARRWPPAVSSRAYPCHPCLRRGRMPLRPRPRLPMPGCDRTPTAAPWWCRPS